MKIAVLSSHTPSLFWFRMDMMKEFINNGHTVIAMGPEPEADWKVRFNDYDIDYRQLYVERNGVNPIKDLKTFKELCIFMKKEKPDKVFSYQAKTVVYGSIAARINNVTEIYPLIAGLGSIFRGTGFKNKIVKTVMEIEYGVAFKCSKKVFFQNNDDKNEFIHYGLIKDDKAVIINGSGVNLDKFKPTPLPEGPAFLFIGRLIKDKGIMEYLEACKEIKKSYKDVRCLLVGPFDSNPSALRPEELQPYIVNDVVEYFGEQKDVRPFLAQSSVYVLPSHHEGTPKTVLEAMAMGRPIITSNAPGCRETVLNGVNGYLIDVNDVKGLVAKMEYLICNPQIRQEMGLESCKIAKEKYDVNKIDKSIINIMKLENMGEMQNVII